MANVCPRCKFEGISKSMKSTKVAEMSLEVARYECPACGTKLYFEEDLFVYLASMTDMAAAKTQAPK